MTMPSTDSLSDPEEYQKIFHWAETQKDGTIPSFNTRRNDPYDVCCSIIISIKLLTNYSIVPIRLWQCVRTLA